MGFAKYHEDNREMWEERNRDRKWQPKRESPLMISKNAADQNRNTNGTILTPPRNNNIIMMKGI